MSAECHSKIARSADGTAVGESGDEYCRESVKRTSCQEGVPSTSVHVQAVGSCANAEFLKSRLMNSIRDATRSCSSTAVGGVSSKIRHQVGRVTEVTVPADLGLGVHPRHPLPDADPEGPVSSVGVVPRVSTAPPKDSVAEVPDHHDKFSQAEALARDLLRSQQLDASSCLRLIGLLPKDQSMRTSQESSVGGFKVSFGFYVRAGQSRVFNNCANMPMVYRYLTALVRKVDPCLEFGALQVLVNVQSGFHLDKSNAKGSMNLVAPLTHFSNGQVWVRDEHGHVAHEHNGASILGSLCEVSSGPVRIDPSVSSCSTSLAG